jgi:hypothetical protein
MNRCGDFSTKEMVAQSIFPIFLLLLLAAFGAAVKNTDETFSMKKFQL